MITLTELFPPDQQDPHGTPFYSDEMVAKMQQRLASSYEAVFTGKGSRDDADLVLVDLALFTRYLDTTPLDTPAEIVKALDQRRAVFARIVEAVIGAGGNMDGLHRAVLATPALTEEN